MDKKYNHIGTFTERIKAYICEHDLLRSGEDAFCVWTIQAGEETWDVYTVKR